MTNKIRQYVGGSAGIGPDTSPHNDGGYHLPRLCSQLTFDGCRPWPSGEGGEVYCPNKLRNNSSQRGQMRGRGYYSFLCDCWRQRRLGRIRIYDVVHALKLLNQQKVQSIRRIFVRLNGVYTSDRGSKVDIELWLVS